MTQQPPPGGARDPYGPPQHGGPQQYGQWPPPQGQPPQQPYAGQPYGPYPGTAGPQPKAPMSGPAKAIGWIFAVLGILAIVGCIGAWVTADLGIFGHISMNGYGQVSGTVSESPDDVKDGVLVTVLAVVILVFGVVRGLGKLGLTAAIVTLVLGLLCLATTIYDFSDITSNLDGASIGWGLWLCLLASIAMCVTGVVGIVKRS